MMPKSAKGYLVRAMYDWVLSQECTPILSVQDDEHTQVPVAFVQEGSIVLNIAPQATGNFHMGLDEISFAARFNGQSHDIFIPMARVSGLFARETSEGMAFPVWDSTVVDEAGGSAGGSIGGQVVGKKHGFRLV